MRLYVVPKVQQRQPLQLLCIRPSARLSHVKIYLLLFPWKPARTRPCPLMFFFFASTTECQPPLLPFHTVITHLYTREVVCLEEQRAPRKRSVVVFSSSSLLFASDLSLPLRTSFRRAHVLAQLVCVCNKTCVYVCMWMYLYLI